MRFSSLLLACALIAAEAPAPKPLTPEQKTEALGVALAASQARVTLATIARQYEQVEGELRRLEAEEKALMEKLRKGSGAGENCRLNLKAEWTCTPPSK